MEKDTKKKKSWFFMVNDNAPSPFFAGKHTIFIPRNIKGVLALICYVALFVLIVEIPGLDSIFGKILKLILCCALIVGFFFFVQKKSD